MHCRPRLALVHARCIFSLKDFTRQAGVAAQVDGVLWSPNGTLLNAPRPVASTASPPSSSGVRWLFQTYGSLLILILAD